ncbi:MAG TPA: RNA methyltransferase [Ilumatobacteraceae bacterium]
MAIEIDDPADPRLADFVDLRDPDARRRLEGDEFFVAEGPVAIERLIASGHTIRAVLVTPAQHERLGHVLAGLDAPVYVAPRGVLATTVGFNLHRGAIASARRRPGRSIPDVIATARRVVVLEGLNDPENLGAIARSARALGVDALVLDPTCLDPYYRRAVRVSMGQILFMPVARATAWPGDLDRLHEAGFETWALTPGDDADDIWALDVPDRLALVLGAEGPGLASSTIRSATRRVRIPITPGVDSLNVGAAAAVAFAVTQARGARTGGRAQT